MPNNPFHFLLNEPKQNKGFKKQRNVKGNSDEEPEDPKPKAISQNQKDRLRTANALLFTQRKSRHEQKTIAVPSVVDLVEIHFFCAFNLDLQKKFIAVYGMEVVSYKDYNKTVLFEITDVPHFRTFLDHLSLAIGSNEGEEYAGRPYNLIALINTFEFYTTKSRIDVLSGEGCLISLVGSDTNQVRVQTDFLNEYLKARNIAYSYSGAYPELIEIPKLAYAGIYELVANFDAIRLVTSAHQVRIRPGIFGEVRRDYGFEVEIAGDLPVVGIIDSGVSNIDPLRSLLTTTNYDHTGFGVNYDELGHGTMVAGLIAFGADLPTTVLPSYKAYAKFAVLKTLHFNGDNLNVPRLLSDLKDASRNHSVRLFNMSLNFGYAKRYNQMFSDFAYELDKLAFEEDILIIMAVGNYKADDLLELLPNGASYHPAHDYPNFFYDLTSTSPDHDCWQTNIQEPAESLNNLSVGALAGNLEESDATDISPAAELPAYYSRKFHYDISQDINGTTLSSRQHSRHLNKPDLVFDGGDLHSAAAGIEILSAPNAATGQYYDRTCGTSLATPLITSLAARILRAYPTLRMQSIKALLINNAEPPVKNPPNFRNFTVNVYRKLIGFGKPNTKNLVDTDGDAVTFVIEESIGVNDVKVIPLYLPSLVARGGTKYHFSMTLCYSFEPVRNNHLNYLPLQIAFGAFKSLDANEIATTKNLDTVKIKSEVSWSEDFFGVENRQFSNTQKQEFNLNEKNIADCNNQVGIAVRCTMKKEIPEYDKNRLANSAHRFSIAITVTEIPELKSTGTLFADLTAINTITAISNLEGMGDIELEA